MQRIVVAITGASGAIYGVKLIDALVAAGCETHLIVSGAGAEVLSHEVGLTVEDLASRVHASYGLEEIGATPASGTASWRWWWTAPSLHLGRLRICRRSAESWCGPWRHNFPCPLTLPHVGPKIPKGEATRPRKPFLCSAS